MPHFSPTDLLRQKSMLPANYEHSQAQAVWTVQHNLDIPGTPTVIVYDAAALGFDDAWRLDPNTFAAVCRRLAKK